MQDDYFPQSYPNKQEWFENQNTELTEALATQIGASAPERTAFLASVAALLGPAAHIVELMEQLDQATADFEDLEAQHLPILRAFIKRGKTSAGCTAAIQLVLKWAGQTHEFDAATARPFITATAMRGRVKITGKKPGFEAYNLYWRKKGDVEWKLMAIRKRKFPYYDETPLAVAGTPEVREYMAIGVIADEEAGQPSEIKEVVYAG